MSSREAFEDADNLRLRPNGQKFLILLGETGSGKSTFVNQCLSNLGVSEERYADVGSSSGIQSVTKNVTFYPALSEGHSSSGLNWNLVDTPGFDNSDTSLDDEEIKNMIVRTLGAQGSRTRKCAVIYFQSTRGLGTSSPFFHTLEREIRSPHRMVPIVTASLIPDIGVCYTFRDEYHHRRMCHFDQTFGAELDTLLQDEPRRAHWCTRPTGSERVETGKESLESSSQFCVRLVQSLVETSDLTIEEFLHAMEIEQRLGARQKPKLFKRLLGGIFCWIKSPRRVPDGRQQSLPSRIPQDISDRVILPQRRAQTSPTKLRFFPNIRSKLSLVSRGTRTTSTVPTETNDHQGPGEHNHLRSPILGRMAMIHESPKPQPQPLASDSTDPCLMDVNEPQSIDQESLYESASETMRQGRATPIP